MLYEKIMGVSKALGCLGGQVSSEQWELIRLAKKELMDAADQAQELEGSLQVRQWSRDQARREEFFKDTDASKTVSQQ